MSCLFDGFIIGSLTGWLSGTNDYAYKRSKTGEIDVAYPIPTLKYHSSWDWLMPVVEKIEKTKNSDGYKYQVDIQNNHCLIESSNYSSSLDKRIYGEIKIKAVWLAVVEFIHWYNKQKDGK